MHPVRLCLALLACLGLSAAAQASPVHIHSVETSEALAEKTEEYGERDIERLLTRLTETITERLERDGHVVAESADAVQVAVTLENAWPNRPTREQMSENPSLSFRSVSLGGASVRALLTDADGNEISQISYSWRTRTIDDSVGRGTWSDAHRTFDRFARNLAEEVNDHAS